MKKAIIFGASGLIGSHLLTALLNDPVYDLVTAVVRKPLKISHPKLKVLIGDFTTLEALKEQIVADEIFLTLGTTKENTPDQRKYYEVDHDYPVAAAKVAQENGAKAVSLVTSVGANADSSVFYLKTKGETERDIIALGFATTHIFRPSMLLGDRKEHRSAEKLIMKIWPAIDWILMGGLNKYRGIHVRDVAQAMINAQKANSGILAIFHWKEMQALL